MEELLHCLRCDQSMVGDNLFCECKACGGTMCHVDVGMLNICRYLDTLGFKLAFGNVVKFGRGVGIERKHYYAVMIGFQQTYKCELFSNLLATGRWEYVSADPPRVEFGYLLASNEIARDADIGAENVHISEIMQELIRELTDWADTIQDIEKTLEQYSI